MKRTRTKRAPSKKTIRSWTRARARGGILEGWRKRGATVQVQLRRPRVIDVVPIDFLRGEPVEQQGKPTLKFRGRLIYFTTADVTIRRASGAILVIDNYEIASLSDRTSRLEPIQ